MIAASWQDNHWNWETLNITNIYISSKTEIEYYKWSINNDYLNTNIYLKKITTRSEDIDILVHEHVHFIWNSVLISDEWQLLNLNNSYNY